MKRILGLGLLALIAVLASCGTSSSGSGSGGDVTVTVTATGASAAAYHAGSAAWQAPSDPTTFSFTVSGGGAYEVAVRCGDDIVLVALTTNELSALDLSCPTTPSTIAFDVSYDVSGVTGAAGAVLFYKGSGFSGIPKAGVTNTFNVGSGLAGTQDLVVIAVDNGGNLLAAKTATVTAAAGGTYSVPALTDADAVGGAAFPDFSALVPTGYTPGWMVLAITANDTTVPAGQGSDSGGPGSTYYLYPFAARTLYVAFAENPPYSIGTIVAQASGTPTLTFPSTIDPSASGAPVSVSNLSAGANLLAYAISVNWGTPVGFSVTISKGFLGSSTAYTLPDLTALGGFSDAMPASGDTVNVTVTAFESNLSLADLIALDEDSIFFLPAGISLSISEKSINYVLP